MKPIKLISESDLSYFISPKTVDDVEKYINALILIRKHIDSDSNIENKYYVRLFDVAPENSSSYKVNSNSIGLECIRVLTKNHTILDGGSESEKSTYLSFYCVAY